MARISVQVLLPTCIDSLEPSPPAHARGCGGNPQKITAEVSTWLCVLGREAAVMEAVFKAAVRVYDARGCHGDCEAG